MKERKDPKGRILQRGETYDSKTGRYRYSRTIDGIRIEKYSWTLTPHDPIPKGKKQKKGESLREIKDKIEKDRLNGISESGGDMTVLVLLQRWVELQNPKVRETTRKGYTTQLNYLSNEENTLAYSMAKKKIRDVKAFPAEEWFLKLNKEKGRSYSSLHTLKGMLKQAFELAKKSNWIENNPFDFSMTKKAYGGTKTRDALSRADMRRFLDFVQTHKHYKIYYDGIYILFFTGLRISEFCGLNAEDIDFEKHVIHVRWQLERVWVAKKGGKTNEKTGKPEGKLLNYIERPKTDNGIRDIPMLPDVEKAFKNVIKNRPTVNEEIVWDETHQFSKTGFLWIDKDGKYEVAQHWQNHIKDARNRFNELYKDELPPISPHVIRHTFCSNCAGSGMSPKTLQVIMGHSSIEFTLNVYTHVEAGDVKKNFFSFMNTSNYDLCGYNRTPDIVSPDDDIDIEEEEVNFEEAIDDDDE